jgi:excinuclease ABC subunit C
VGKAKSLRPRVRSYFQASPMSGTRSRSCRARRRHRGDRHGSEVEALHLEQNLVKRYRPPFNVRLRDDKSFPYIAVTVEDDFPASCSRASGTGAASPTSALREREEGAGDARRPQSRLPVPPCEGPKPGRHSGIPCLDYHIERCHAPCVDYISKEAYAEIIDGVINFLSGDTRTIERELERQMHEAAEGERFEEAARYRNRLFAVRRLSERQAVEKRSVGDVDVLGLAVDGDKAAVQIFPLRGGKMIDRYGFHLENVEGQDTSALLEAFCVEYYGLRLRCRRRSSCRGTRATSRRSRSS